MFQPAQEGVIRLQVVGVFAYDESFLLQGELQLQRRHNPLYNLVLQGKNVREWAIILLRPHLIARRRVDQLHRDPDTLVRFLHAPFQHVPHAHLATDVLHFYCFAFVSEGGVASDDQETRDFGEIASEHFGQTVAEVVLLGIITEIHQRQDYERGFLGQGQRWRQRLVSKQ